MPGPLDGLLNHAVGVGNVPFPITPYNPSIMERMFPDFGMGNMLDQGQMGGLRRQGLLQMGLSMLANSGQSTERRGLGQLLAGGFQQGQQGFQQALGGALQGQQMMAQIAQQKLQQERQAAFDGIAAKYKPVPGETPDQRRERMASMISEFIAIDPAGMGGKLNAFANVFDAPKAEKPEDVRGTMVEQEGKQILIDPRTGKVIATYGAKPAPQRGEGKAPTQAQETAAYFAGRMIPAERDIRSLEDAGVSLPDEALFFSPSSKKGMVIYAKLNPEQQRLYAIMDDWIAAKLRKESGAVISDSEWQAEARRYFRGFADKPDVAPVKRSLRARANKGFVSMSGEAFSLSKDDNDLIDDKPKKRPGGVAGGSDSTAPRNLDRYFK
jgi:hypothetical protein